MKPIDAGIILLVMLIWGLNFVMGKWALAQVPPIFLMALRFALVAALLLPFVTLPRDRLRGILALSITLGCVHFSLMFTGLRDVDAAVASIAIQTQVPFAALLAAMFLGDRLGWRRLLGMALAFAGIAVMAGEPRFSSNLLPIGLIVAGALMWAIANIQIKQLGAVDGFALSAYMSLFAVPQLLAASYLLESGQVDALARATWQAWASLAYMAVMVTIISYAMWYRLLRRYPVNQAMPFTLLVPIFGVLSGVVLLDEPLGWRIVIGGLATVAGVGIIVIRRPRLADPEAASKTV
jgi:O-acetylserine/cysteine efflux transporter